MVMRSTRVNRKRNQTTLFQGIKSFEDTPGRKARKSTNAENVFQTLVKKKGKV